MPESITIDARLISPIGKDGAELCGFFPPHIRQFRVAKAIGSVGPLIKSAGGTFKVVDRRRQGRRRRVGRRRRNARR